VRRGASAAHWLARPRWPYQPPCGWPPPSPPALRQLRLQRRPACARGHWPLAPRASAAASASATAAAALAAASPSSERRLRIGHFAITVQKLTCKCTGTVLVLSRSIKTMESRSYGVARCCRQEREAEFCTGSATSGGSGREMQVKAQENRRLS
jgi:hypothetical protein